MRCPRVGRIVSVDFAAEPDLSAHGQGPMEAVDDFLATTEDFVIDEDMHMFLVTANSSG